MPLITDRSYFDPVLPESLPASISNAADELPRKIEFLKSLTLGMCGNWCRAVCEARNKFSSASTQLQRQQSFAHASAPTEPLRKNH